MAGPGDGWTADQAQQASIAELAAGRLPLEAQRRLREQRAGGAFTSTLTVAELHSIRSVGFTPVGQVLGSCVYQIGYTGMWNCGYWGRGGMGGGLGGWGGGGRWGGGTGWSGPGAPPRGTATPGWQPGGWGGGPGGGGWGGGGPGGGGWTGASVVEASGVRHSLYEARSRAMERMRQECALLGADGVVAVRLTVGPFPSGGLEFQAIGTAVRADGPVRPQHPFLSELSGQEFALLVGAGWVPCALVLGISVMVRHDDWMTYQQTASWSNQEVHGYTELLRAARDGARQALREDCARYGGTTVVVRNIGTRIGEHECRAVENGHDHVVEAMVVGTAIVGFEHAGGNAPEPPLPVVRL